MLCVFMLDKLKLGQNITLITPQGSITAAARGLLFQHVGLLLFYIILSTNPPAFHRLDMQWSIENISL